MILFILSWLIIGVVFGYLTVKIVNPSEYKPVHLIVYALCGWASVISFILMLIFGLLVWLDKK